MSDAGSDPSETPRGEKKRAREYETPITEPNAKAQRAEAAWSIGGSASQILEQLQASVAAVEALNTDKLDDAQLAIVRRAGSALFQISHGVTSRRKARKEAEQLRPAEDTPLPSCLWQHPRSTSSIACRPRRCGSPMSRTRSQPAPLARSESRQEREKVAKFLKSLRVA